MKSIFSLMSIAFIMNINSAELYSQNITKWEYLDSTDLSYGFISVNNKNDFIIWENIDRVYPSGFHYYSFEIKLYNNDGKNHKVIYYDTIHGHYTDYDSIYGLDEINSLAHPSENVIIAVGYNRTYLGYYENSTWDRYSSLMIISTDGGNTFQRKILDSNVTLGSVIMFDSINGVMIKYEHDNYFNRKDTLHDSLRITNDCWKTYNSLPLPEDVYKLKAFSPEILACKKVEDRNTIFYRSSDGGKSWQNYKLENYILQGYKFLTKDKIIGFGRYNDNTKETHHILKSNDGGENWRVIDNINLQFKIHFRNTTYKYSDIDFCDSLNGFLTEFWGSIFKTNDGGESWVQELFPFSENYPDISQDQEGFAGIIYPSIDFAVALAKQNFVLITENKLVLYPPHFYSPVNRQYKTVNNVQLSWTSINNAKKYRFRISGAINETGLASFDNPDLDTLISDTTIVLNNLNYNSYYNCWIKAIADTTESDWSFEYPLFWTITHEGALYPPLLTYPALNDSGIPVNTTLRWDSVPGATKYVMILYKILNPNPPYPPIPVLIKTDTNIVVNFYLLDSTLLEPNTTYWVYLQSKNNDTSSGNGVYAFTTVLTVGVNDFYPNLNKVGLSIFPNPASERCIIRFNFEPFNVLGLKLYNSMGIELADLTRSAQLIYGNKVLELNLSSLTSGVYYIVLQDRQGIYSKSFVLVK
ncbi:MAG: hypothetical protein A2X61_05525 [Ignavibacteria bacterium GWB2_35_12]|nr:MAG: hypothetical protein A2X61_05525 [Ignavibacteria bacterium GWB2_35_12]OGU87645.1 MAG: hypothetical protein A2220_12625 [Ignavibacteria bacterium RIFOXYA2_FULL_35_10]OGV24784.1 MAG: hypothetical protein A2475_14335 [Ignavibacteria bacterium RIFOXYC2_FULL_35_21]